MRSIFKKTGILGINARNFHYIRPYNPKKAIRLADDKLKTKHFLSARGVPVPKLFGVIKSYEELERFDFNILPSAFVLKPNFGYGGEGIVPIVEQEEEFFVKSSGELISKNELEEVISDTLEGRFSISGASDFAFFEQLIVCDDRLGKFAYKGLPDIRIVVHNLIPVMAMLRLPTRQSDGKANLHQGAVGVGIDIARGTATHIVHHNRIVHEIPEIGPIRGLKIPYWDDILLMASRAQLATNLGYLAADIAIDNNTGPVLLEINARAGLNVQIANLAPLRRRLERIQGLKVISPEKGIRIAQDMFGNKLEKEVKKISGKVVIGSREKVKIITKNDTHHIWASINPLLERSLLDRELAENLGLSEEEGTESVKTKFVLAENRIQTLARLDDLSGKDFKMVVGRRDLQDFLIDPSKGKKVNIIAPQTSLPLVDLDKDLVSIDRQIKLLHHLKPLNLSAEREK
ncbi:MAG: sugar-transfer associated ATP-grasp domain-containing protein, partial [Patescibacteria group bacterium]